MAAPYCLRFRAIALRLRAGLHSLRSCAQFWSCDHDLQYDIWLNFDLERRFPMKLSRGSILAMTIGGLLVCTLVFGSALSAGSSQDASNPTATLLTEVRALRLAM